MKIIIAGDGKVGLTLTQKLSAAGHDLTLIDSNQRVLDSSVERYDVMGVQGNCASMRVLESADVKRRICSLQPPVRMKSICSVV